MSGISNPQIPRKIHAPMYDIKANILTFGFIAFLEEIVIAAINIAIVPKRLNIPMSIPLTYIIKFGAPGLAFQTTLIHPGGI